MEVLRLSGKNVRDELARYVDLKEDKGKIGRSAWAWGRMKGPLILLVASKNLDNLVEVFESKGKKEIKGPDLTGFEVSFEEPWIRLGEKTALAWDAASGRGAYAWEERGGGLFVAVAMLPGESVVVRVTG